MQNYPTIIFKYTPTLLFYVKMGNYLKYDIVFILVAFPNSENNNSLEGLFDDHVKTCSLQNWKYWIFSQALRPILQTYEK